MFPSPYRELHFSIAQVHGNARVYGKFPSPYGELHFSIRQLKTLTKVAKFPSPYGELHFSIVHAYNGKHLTFK